MNKEQKAALLQQHNKWIEQYVDRTIKIYSIPRSMRDEFLSYAYVTFCHALETYTVVGEVPLVNYLKRKVKWSLISGVRAYRGIKREGNIFYRHHWQELAVSALNTGSGCGYDKLKEELAVTWGRSADTEAADLDKRIAIKRSLERLTKDERMLIGLGVFEQAMQTEHGKLESPETTINRHMALGNNSTACKHKLKAIAKFRALLRKELGKDESLAE